MTSKILFKIANDERHRTDACIVEELDGDTIWAAKWHFSSGLRTATVFQRVSNKCEPDELILDNDDDFEVTIGQNHNYFQAGVEEIRFDSWSRRDGVHTFLRSPFN